MRKVLPSLLALSLITVPAYQTGAAVTASVTYKLSVTIPETAGAIETSPVTNPAEKSSVRKPDLTFQQETVIRDQQLVLLKTYVTK